MVEAYVVLTAMWAVAMQVWYLMPLDKDWKTISGWGLVLTLAWPVVVAVLIVLGLINVVVVGLRGERGEVDG